MKTYFLPLLLLAAGSVPAAELRLRSDVQATGSLLTLADLADIHASSDEEAKLLGEIDLLPAPPAGERRTLRAREVQDLLAVRGVNLAQHRFSGSSTIAVRGPKRESSEEDRTPAKPIFSKPKLRSKAQDAIGKYLKREADKEQSWVVSLELADETADELATLKGDWEIAGGEAPWTGWQQFSVRGTRKGQVVEVPLAAEISLPPTLVVATRPLPRGVLIQADDLKLQVGNPTLGRAQVFQSIEEVVGKETTRVIAEGQVLDDSVVRRQLLVRRNEVVTVYARAAGVSVRTTGRARDDGGEGDLVLVESLAERDRTTFTARVSGPQEVEIFVQAPTVTSRRSAK